MIDLTCPYDERVDTKELEKIEHYQDLAWELRNIWNMKVKVIPIVISALETTPIKWRNWLKEIGIQTQIHTTQILWKVLLTRPQELNTAGTPFLQKGVGPPTKFSKRGAWQDLNI